MAQKVIGAVIAIALVVGVKFYNKSSATAEVKAHMVKLCGGDAACEQAVGTHFEACFEQAYKMGGRRRDSRLEGGQLVQCVNSRAGKPYFSFTEK